MTARLSRRFSIGLTRKAVRFAAGSLLALVFAGSAAFAEPGTVTFGNHGSGKVINGPTGNPATAAEGVRAALYWSPVGTNRFMQLGESVPVGVPVPGVFAGGTRITGEETQGGSAGQFIVRAWSGGHAKFEDAAGVSGEGLGESDIIEVVTGDPAGDPPSPPASLMAAGLGGFEITANTGSFPLPLIDCPDDLIVECGDSWTFDSPTAFGGCGTNLTINLLDTVTNGACPRVIVRTWSVTDECGNSSICSQTVLVRDTTPPALVCAADKSVECDSVWGFDAPAVSDVCSGSDVSLTVLATVTNGLCPTRITRTWLATDLCGNTDTCSQTVTILCSQCDYLTLTKDCPPHPTPPGGVLAYTGTVTNNGNLTLTNLLVYLDRTATSALVFGPATLLPGEGAEFSGSYTVGAHGPFEDTLTALARTETGLVVSNSLTTSCPVAESFVSGDRDGDGIIDQAELNAVLANYWAHSDWVSMTNVVAGLGDGTVQFALTNTSGWDFSVLVSSNMIDWTPLPGQAHPVYQFHDPEATNEPVRYYRLTWP